MQRRVKIPKEKTKNSINKYKLFDIYFDKKQKTKDTKKIKFNIDAFLVFLAHDNLRCLRK